EEFLYRRGTLLDPVNSDLPFPLNRTGPQESAGYLQQLHEFVGATLGAEAQARYEIIIDDPILVARKMKQGLAEVERFRRERNDAFHFNWLLKIEEKIGRAHV